MYFIACGTHDHVSSIHGVPFSRCESTIQDAESLQNEVFEWFECFDKSCAKQHIKGIFLSLNYFLEIL